MEELSLLKQFASWLAIPLTGVLGLVGYHYKHHLNKIDELSDKHQDLEVKVNINNQKIKDISRMCEHISYKIDDIDAFLRKNHKS